MNLAREIVFRIEGLGGCLALGQNGGVRCRIPKDSPVALALLEAARADKQAILDYLRARNTVPAMPPGVKLVRWNLKEPPVAMETCAVVTDSALFARTTLEQLRIALGNSKRWVGWSVPQLVDRLAQVGVVVEIEPRNILGANSGK